MLISVDATHLKLKSNWRNIYRGSDSSRQPCPWKKKNLKQHLITGGVSGNWFSWWFSRLTFCCPDTCGSKRGAIPASGRMESSKRVSDWSVDEVLEWVEQQFPGQQSTLQTAFLQHAVSGTRSWCPILSLYERLGSASNYPSKNRSAGQIWQVLEFEPDN